MQELGLALIYTIGLESRYQMHFVLYASFRDKLISKSTKLTTVKKKKKKVTTLD